MAISEVSVALVTSQMDNSQNCIAHAYTVDIAKEAKDVDGSSVRKLIDHFII